MPYIPHTPEDEKEMLATIGVDSIEDLFREIPAELRVKPGSLDIPNSLSEDQLYQKMVGLARQNLDATKLEWYLGAGLYDRHIPAVIAPLISRGEYLTSYTPYQPEMSQGYLQAIYEFQSMIAEVYDMDAANASMYDGATSLAEACLMACAHTGRKKVYVSEAVHPSYRQVVETYLWATEDEVATIDTTDGVTTGYAAVADDAGCVVVQYPNFFGAIEDLAEARRVATANGALLVVVADPVAMALLPPPGQFGADVVVGEGQPLGVAMGFGGPLVGLYACKSDYMRRLPGRIVGRTHDHSGRSAFTMTLRTREQDIRREKATSNICTNEALMALANTIYLSALGKNGLKSVATSTVNNTQYAMQVLTAAGAKLKFSGRVFGEFVLDLGRDATAVQSKLIDAGIMPGLPLGPYYSGMDNCMLVALTEVRTKAQIDRFAAELKKVLS
ncbi:MAG: aminomethyl-transferring glycine dehydrogenase subunit GcvPA [Chthonomonas sp.]|nr:aminomethyl-transferring glycine dehydrogenase subunit GcvPA [Chthonomonas sp.]